MTPMRVFMWILLFLGSTLCYLSVQQSDIWGGILSGLCLGQALSMPSYMKALDLLDEAQDRNVRLLAKLAKKDTNANG